MFELTPRIPEGPPATALWHALAAAQRPAGLAQFLEEWLPTLTGLDLPAATWRRWQVTGRVLLDLTRQGWLFDAPTPGRLLATPPTTTTFRTGQPTPGRLAPAEVKQQLRKALVAHRDEQLHDPKIQQFVGRMEAVRRYRGQRVSVRSLLVEPAQLAADLGPALATPAGPAREALLADVVQPYLQLATEQVDEHTGLRLLDIWRYCRHTWSLPYHSQPGRRMFYLVRDRARPRHPVMGIAALGSAVVQISLRDRAIGWDLKTLRRQPLAEAAARMPALRTELTRAIAEIYHADFLEEGLLMAADLQQPSAAALAALLQATADQPHTSRRQETQARYPSLEAEARSPLFRRKRARVLGELLGALVEFNKVRVLDDASQFTELCRYSEGLQALRTTIRSNKKRHVAASIMEITTCGAIPPYGELLGGKLVSLLMASPQVISDYHLRYNNFTSVIASRMQGAELARAPHLVLLGTTSLYHVGSSQYNRLHFPATNGKVEYKLLGMTEGYGSVHFSNETYAAIQKLLLASETQQSYAFAAGVNYKLRSIAAGLGMLNMQQLQKHGTPRLVYMLPLAENWQEYLTGQEEKPRWLYADVASPEAETEIIINYWKKRWFVPRAQRIETVIKLQSSELVASLITSTDHPQTSTAADSIVREPLFFF